MTGTLSRKTILLSSSALILLAYGMLTAQAATPIVGQASVTRTGSGATNETIVMPVFDIGATTVSSCEFSLDGGLTWTSGGQANFKSSAAGKYCEFKNVNVSNFSNPDLVRMRIINSDLSLALNPLPVIVDGAAPGIAIQEPSSESFEDDAPSLSVKTNETATCSGKLDEGVIVPLTSTGGLLHSASYSNVSNGSHTLSVECTDWLGNKSAKSVKFSVAPLFKDTVDHWGLAYVAALKKKCTGVEGYRDAAGNLLHEFRPNSSMNRAELVTILVRCAYGYQQVPTVSPFTDVPVSEYYAGYVVKAKELGWISGYANGTFRPGNSVTRAEALKIILLSQFADSEISDGDTIISFIDVEQSWYRRFVFFAVSRGFADGLKDAGGNLTGYFKPEAAITRAEVAKIVALAKGWVQK